MHPLNTNSKDRKDRAERHCSFIFLFFSPFFRREEKRIIQVVIKNNASLLDRLNDPLLLKIDILHILTLIGSTLNFSGNKKGDM